MDYIDAGSFKGSMCDIISSQFTLKGWTKGCCYSSCNEEPIALHEYKENMGFIILQTQTLYSCFGIPNDLTTFYKSYYSSVLKL